MTVASQEKPTHVKIQRIDFLTKSFKVIVVFCILNILLDVANYVWHGFNFQYLSLKFFDTLLIFEGALCLISSITIASARPGAKKIIEENSSYIQRGVIFNRDISKLFHPLKDSFIYKYLTSETVVRKSEISGIVGLLSGCFLLFFSITLDILFITKKLF